MDENFGLRRGGGLQNPGIYGPTARPLVIDFTALPRAKRALSNLDPHFSYSGAHFARASRMRQCCTRPLYTEMLKLFFSQLGYSTCVWLIEIS